MFCLLNCEKLDEAVALTLSGVVIAAFAQVVMTETPIVAREATVAEVEVVENSRSYAGSFKASWRFARNHFTVSCRPFSKSVDACQPSSRSARGIDSAARLTIWARSVPHEFARKPNDASNRLCGFTNCYFAIVAQVEWLG